VFHIGVGSRVEVGWNTSIVALQVVEGDEKGTLSPEDMNTGTWFSRLRVGRKAIDLAL
jgi:hypothetical protein